MVALTIVGFWLGCISIFGPNGSTWQFKLPANSDKPLGRGFSLLGAGFNPAFDDNDWRAFSFSAIMAIVDLDREGKLANVDTIVTD